MSCQTQTELLSLFVLTFGMQPPLKIIFINFLYQDHETANVTHDTIHSRKQHHKLIVDTFHPARCNPAEGFSNHLPLLHFLPNP